MEKTNNIFFDSIHESDIAFELQLLKDAKNVEIWKHYLNHKQEYITEESTTSDYTTTMKLKEELLVLYYRQFWAFDKEYGYWEKFIDYYTKMIKSLDLETNGNDLKIGINKIADCFNRESGIFGNETRFWIKYLKFLQEFKLKVKFVSEEFILSIFKTCLKTLEVDKHLPIWSLFFNDIWPILKLSDDALKFTIYLSWSIFLKNCLKFNVFQSDLQDESLPNLDTTFIKLLKYMNETEEIKEFEILFKELMKAKYLVKFATSELDLYNQYFERLTEISVTNESNDQLKNKLKDLFLAIIKKFPDQQSLITVRYSKYLIRIDQFDKAVEISDKLYNNSLTIKDFTIVFDFLTENLEKKIIDISDVDEKDPSIEKYMGKLEGLLSSRLILLNDVKLRQNMNSPLTWNERIDLFKDGGDVEKVLECYAKAVVEINVRKVPKDEMLLLPKIWCDYARMYFEKGDILTARKLLDTASKVPWIELEQLETVWISWLKCEIGLGNVKHAAFLCSNAISVPEQILKGKVDIEDESLSFQMKLFKSVRLWSLYLDLLENTGDFEEVCKGYEDAIELKVINGVMLINYCLFLEENGHIEKSFSIFERGVQMFTGDSKSILFGIYLNKILKYWKKLGWNEERVREIFEGCIDVVDAGELKQVYLLYSEWEMNFGSQLRSLKIVKEAISQMERQQDKLQFYQILIMRTIETKGVEWVVEIFKEAIETISVQLPGYISELVAGFVNVEIALGEPDKARVILEYAAENVMEFNRSNDDRELVWTLFKAFELENGDETTYKAMLRKKIYLENMYGKVQSVHRQSAPAPPLLGQSDSAIGFVASSNPPKNATVVLEADHAEQDQQQTGEPHLANPQNEDVIELDMDLDLETDL